MHCTCFSNKITSIGSLSRASSVAFAAAAAAAAAIVAPATAFEVGLLRVPRPVAHQAQAFSMLFSLLQQLTLTLTLTLNGPPIVEPQLFLPPLFRGLRRGLQPRPWAAPSRLAGPTR